MNKEKLNGAYIKNKMSQSKTSWYLLKRGAGLGNMSSRSSPTYFGADPKLL